MSQYDPIVTFRLPPPRLKQLKAAAKRDDRTVSSLTRRIITSALDQYEERKETPARTDDAGVQA